MRLVRVLSWFCFIGSSGYPTGVASAASINGQRGRICWLDSFEVDLPACKMFSFG